MQTVFVAAAASILADVAERCFERIQVFYACFGGLGITTRASQTGGTFEDARDLQYFSRRSKSTTNRIWHWPAAVSS